MIKAESPPNNVIFENEMWFAQRVIVDGIAYWVSKRKHASVKKGPNGTLVPGQWHDSAALANYVGVLGTGFEPIFNQIVEYEKSRDNR